MAIRSETPWKISRMPFGNRGLWSGSNTILTNRGTWRIPFTYLFWTRPTKSQRSLSRTLLPIWNTSFRCRSATPPNTRSSASTMACPAWGSGRGRSAWPWGGSYSSATLSAASYPLPRAGNEPGRPERPRTPPTSRGFSIEQNEKETWKWETDSFHLLFEDFSASS